MNAAALSFLTSLETPSKLSFSAEFPAEGEAGESAGNGAFDGFANLLDQLVQIAPVDAAIPAVGAKTVGAQDMLAAADAESGKDGGNGSGKILPVLPGLLPLQISAPLEDASAGKGGTVTELPVGRLDMARFAQPVAMPQQVSVLSHPSLAQAETQDRAQPDAVSIRQMPVAEAQLSRAITGLVDPRAASATIGTPPSASTATNALPQSVTNAPVSIAAMPGASIERAPIAAITIAARPTTTVSVSAHLETASAKTLPVAASDTARAIMAAKDTAPTPAPVAIRQSAPVSEVAAQAVATVLPASAVKGDAKPAPAAQAAAIAPVAASKSEAEPDTARPVEAVQATARVATAAEAIRPEPAIAASVGQPVAPTQAEAVTRAADLARPDAFAAIDSIARMVDRLSAARDFGVVPTAALAVMHKEFGELSIAIDRISDTLQVEVAAKDGEAQRALAAALANDRAAAMAGDRSVQRSAEAQQNGGQNGGQSTGQNNGHGANSSAADTSGQAASGNAQSQREGQGRERNRSDGPALHARNSAASDRQPTSDDGRYA